MPASRPVLMPASQPALVQGIRLQHRRSLCRSVRDSDDRPLSKSTSVYFEFVDRERAPEMAPTNEGVAVELVAAKADLDAGSGKVLPELSVATEGAQASPNAAIPRVSETAHGLLGAVPTTDADAATIAITAQLQNTAAEFANEGMFHLSNNFTAHTHFPPIAPVQVAPIDVPDNSEVTGPPPATPALLPAPLIVPEPATLAPIEFNGLPYVPSAVIT